MDAWKQMDELLERYTKRTDVRPDITVVAHATQRGVELIVWDDPALNPLSKRGYKSTGKRNVGALRELAQAINDACDFVQQSNPEWAEGLDIE